MTAIEAEGTVPIMTYKNLKNRFTVEQSFLALLQAELFPFVFPYTLYGFAPLRRPEFGLLSSNFIELSCESLLKVVMI